MISLAEWRLRIGMFLHSVHCGRPRSTCKYKSPMKRCSTSQDKSVLYLVFAAMSVLFLLVSGDIQLNPGPKDDEVPTYDELIDLLAKAEHSAMMNGNSVSLVLSTNFRQLYPHIQISRNDRFLDTVRRIAAPTLPSSLGPSKLNGSALRTYLTRTWTPKNRHRNEYSHFPEYLSQYGLCQDLLATTFQQTQNASTTFLSWCLSRQPTVAFYKHLHSYLKQWPVTKKETKTAIGRFYNAIDPFLREKSLRPDNAYQYIERAVKGTTDHEIMSFMNYGQVAHKSSCTTIDPQAEPNIFGEEVDVSDPTTETQHCLNEPSSDNLMLKIKQQEQWICRLEQELKAARTALCDVTNTFKKANRQLQRAEKALDIVDCESKLAVHKNEDLEEQLGLSKQTISALQKEIGSLKETSPLITATGKDQQVQFYCETKTGRFYSSAIRKLYYKLLADLIPPDKIEQTIKAVLKCFIPEVDLSQLHLPRARCAAYMRSCELETVSMAQKTMHFSEVVQSDQSIGLTLNSDGTTLNQRKLGAAVMSGTVISLNEIPDGCAQTIVDDIDSELSKLRNMAKLLKLPNADVINWTLVTSSTSDSAATQKKLNDLIVEKKARDEAVYGPARSVEGRDLVRNFCAMHLAVNLRTAFLEGMKKCYNPDTIGITRDRYPVDILVHQFCKLFGKKGTPEYGVGVILFPDFLTIKAQLQATDPSSHQLYYKNCLSIVLDRQVGNRYFVTAANAGKILFLRNAALLYLYETGKHLGNKLEREVYSKLQDRNELAWLRADAIMFHHVYADLVTLAKSNDLKKSVLDMNTHYFELKKFLQQLQEHPEAATQTLVAVFKSEKCLYHSENLLNHRIHNKYAVVQDSLFTLDEQDKDFLHPFLVKGAEAMNEKLCTYASSQLPGDMYWNPDKEVKKVLENIRPNNDICESILGLNDWISGHMPNLKQSTCSVLVKVKRNRTLTWLDQLSSQEQDNIVTMAATTRQAVQLEHKAVEEKREKQRRAHLKALLDKRAQTVKKQKQMEAELAHVHVITSIAELHQALIKVDREHMSARQKSKNKLQIIREQIRVRKVLLNEPIKIPFSLHRKQRLIQEIITEFGDYLEEHCNTSSETSEYHNHLALKDLSSLVGKKILHKFIAEDSGKEIWYNGDVIDYNHDEKCHVIKYQGEDQLQHFNLIEDLMGGDLVIDLTQ